MLGREVATLVNEEKSVGNYNVEFNGSNLSSGIYFYKIQAGRLFFSEENDFDKIVCKQFLFNNSMCF